VWQGDGKLVTTCFICGLKISDGEGFALSYLNVGNGDKNMAIHICKEFHRKKKEKQTRLEVLEKRVEQLEGVVRNLLPMGGQQPYNTNPNPFLTPNGHFLGCRCKECLLY
jgi:hypothetical protein